MGKPANRRQFITFVGISALAGCSSPSDGQVDQSISPPHIPSHVIGEIGLNITSQDTETLWEDSFVLGTVSVRADGYTIVYENKDLRDRLNENTLGSLESTSIKVFFVTRVDFSPGIDNLPFGVGRGTVISRTEEDAKTVFIENLVQQGLSEVQEGNSQEISINGNQVSLTEYSAYFSFDSIEVETGVSDPLIIQGEQIRIKSVLAVWHHDSDVFIAGASFPGENFRSEATESITEAIDVTIDIDLGLDPNKYESDFYDFIGAIS